MSALQATPGRKPAGDRQPRRILIVDDDEAFNRALKTGLTENGYQVVSEGDSGRALETAAGFRPDLIVLDICMPGLDGGDVAQRFGDHPLLRNVPIIFLSSIIKPEEADRMTAAGQVCMSKPVRIADLVQRIENCL